jgi:F-type H+-transporting ATPase subunit a
MNISIAPEQLTHIGSLGISNSFVMIWLVAIFLIVVAQLISRKVSLVPKMAQNGVEMAVESLLDMMRGVLGTQEAALKYFPFIATIFTVILASNWLGLVPGVGSIGFFEHAVGAAAGAASTFVPYLRSPSSDLNFTLGLALMTIITINIMGVRALGLKMSIKRYINFSSPINFFIGILELIGEFAKIISLSFRLFGNVFAGEVLLIIIGFLVPYLVPVPFLALELFAGFIQALVFSTLTLVFLSLLVQEQHH